MKSKTATHDIHEIESRLADLYDELYSLDTREAGYARKIKKLIDEIEDAELHLPPRPSVNIDTAFDEFIRRAIDTLRARKQLMIGTRRIHEEQLKAGMAILEAFLEGKTPLLIAQPQQGKTDVCFFVFRIFYQALLFYKSKTRKIRDLAMPLEMLHCINIADNQLRRQTQERVQFANVPVHVIHHAELDKLEPMRTGKRLIIVDECHMALGRNKPFHNFLRRYGIDSSKPRAWQGNDWVLSISATPYAHVIKALIDKDVFEPVALPLSDAYYSLQRMYEDGRLKHAEPLTAKRGQEIVVTDFFAQRLVEFRDTCQKDGKGYMIVRARGRNVDAIINHVSNGMAFTKHRIGIWEYDSERNNLDQLDTTLSHKPPIPTLVIIRGSLRAGKTLTTTKHIRIWLETVGANTDAMTQVVGRCLGYKRDRHTSKFPVYANLEEIDLAIGFYETFYQSGADIKVPKGNWNKSFTSQQTFVQHIVRSYQDIPETIRNRKPAPRIMTISGSNKQDVAYSVFYGSPRSANSPIVKIDGANLHHLSSWQALMQEHPDWLGCYAYYELDHERASEDKLKVSILRRDKSKPEP